jgi:endonuclease/exonuclease/phosphatase family metal-dependent hydrolase
MTFWQVKRLGLGLLTLVCGCQLAADRPPVAATFRVMTYNIHHGAGLDGRLDLDRIAAVIRRERADIVALQEVDKGVRRTTGRDLTTELAALTGMTGVFSNNFHFQDGEYGNAVLTRFPVLSATNSHYQMLRPNEQRGILQLTLAVHGRNVVFMNTHIDSRADDAERWLNLGEIQALARAQDNLPVVVAGDFNDTPGSRVYRRMQQSFKDAWKTAGAGDGWTFPAAQPRKRIDYVWFSLPETLTVTSAYVTPSEASDHLPLVVEFRFR